MPVTHGSANGGFRSACAQRGDDAGGFSIHTGQRVLVHAGGKGFRVVSQPGADNLEMHTSFEGGDGVAVPHVVQTDVRKSAALREPVEPLTDHVRMHGPAVLPREHPIRGGVVTFEEGTLGEPAGSPFHQRGHGDRIVSEHAGAFSVFPSPS